MTEKQQRQILAIMCGKLTHKDYSGFREDIRECLSGGIDQNEVREAILQVFLHAGYPATLEGLFILQDILGNENNPPAGEFMESAIAEKWYKMGLETCRAVYRDKFEKLVKNVEGLSPDLAMWMVTEGYGKVLSRPGLDLAAREMISAAVLAMGDFPRQLHSHLQGALNTGASIEELEELLDKLCEIDAEKGKKALCMFKMIKHKKSPEQK